MGLPAWAGDAQSKPQMAMKPLSFKMRFLGRKTPATRMSRAVPLTIHIDTTERTVNCSLDACAYSMAYPKPIRMASAARVMPGRLLARNQRDGFGSTFVAASVGYAEDDLTRLFTFRSHRLSTSSRRLLRTHVVGREAGRLWPLSPEAAVSEGRGSQLGLHHLLPRLFGPGRFLG